MNQYLRLYSPHCFSPRGRAFYGRRQGFTVLADKAVAVQAVACIGLIIAGGRTLLRPIYRRMADMGNTDVFAATTLLVVLGTSVLTQIAGLSLALGAFLVSTQLRTHQTSCTCAHTQIMQKAKQGRPV